MNPVPLYQVLREIVGWFGLEVRNQRTLLDFALAMLAARSCRLEELAHALQPRGGLEGQYRRLQRLLANEHLDMPSLQQTWARMVLETMRATTVVLLVDDTDLHQHLHVTVLGVWSEGGCVPLAWRCSTPDAYPEEGQVAVIADLLARVMAVLPAGVTVWLVADRGIGTSPALVRRVEAQGCHVLFRVQGSTKFRDEHGQEHGLQSLGVRGESWQSVGEVFKKAGWLHAHVTVTWDERCAQPWCLISTRPVEPAWYGRRFDQEVAFRDLKSDGLDWQRSHVWIPSHAERLLLVLAICYWTIISIGQRLPRPGSGRASRWSPFRRGLEAIAACFRPTIAPFLADDLAPPLAPLPPPFLAPSPPLPTCVVQ